MQAINLRSFKQKARHRKRSLRMFLSGVKKNPPRNLDRIVEKVDSIVWKEIDCLSCANCCKTMSPTYNLKDIVRISAHFGMTPAEFKNKWLVYDKKDRDWINKQVPCQFLDTNTNMCSIYEVRPSDCAGFPHFTKRKFVDYVHVHKQNIEFCPATLRMVEELQQTIIRDKRLQ